MKRKIFVTGDKHGSFEDVIEWAKNAKGLTRDDILIILGDAGLNYYKTIKDCVNKEKLSMLPITFVMIHGNHEERPENCAGYHLEYVNMLGCECWIQDEYPNLLFPKDGLMTIDGKKFLIMGGAYSVDKFLRLTYGWQWFPSEQMPEKTKDMIRELVETEHNFDYVLTHTAPLKYEPRHLFLKNLNQSMIDKSMEIFLDEIEGKISYGFWLFGHYHSDERLGTRVAILYREIRPLSDFTV